jgi:hypothetical protein
MSLETTITALLASATAVDDIIDGRIYAARAPQETQAPYIVWAIIDSGQVEDHDTGSDESPLSDVLISISAYARNYAEAAALSAAARAAIEASDLTLTIDVPRRDDRDDKLQIYRRDFDFTVWVQE